MDAMTALVLCVRILSGVEVFGSGDVRLSLTDVGSADEEQMFVMQI